MNNQRTVAGLLAVIAVLLALNLVLGNTPQAEAQVSTGGNPYIVKLLPVYGSLYVRVWSDGRVDKMVSEGATPCDYEVIGSHGPVEHPFPVVDAVFDSTHSQGVTMLTFEDGRVDMVVDVGTGPRCTIAGIGTPSLCTADVDRNGEIGTADLLELLNQWGPCQ